MLSISRRGTTDRCAVNIVPCQINHNGPAKVTKRYWAPKDEADGTKTVYFRGRRLRGSAVEIPKGYKGLVLENTKKTFVEPVPAPDDNDDDEVPELPQPVKIAEEVSTFDEMVVWQHDQTPSVDDSFVRNLGEWVVLAEAIHAN